MIHVIISVPISWFLRYLCFLNVKGQAKLTADIPSSYISCNQISPCLHLVNPNKSHIPIILLYNSLTYPLHLSFFILAPILSTPTVRRYHTIDKR